MFTPRDILADFKTATFWLASSTACICSFVSPVVQSTIGIRRFTPKANSASVAFAEAKSMITSASSRQSLMFVYTGYPLSRQSTRSMPATISIPSSSWTRLVITWPIWPLQPCIITRTIRQSLLSLSGRRHP